MQLEIAKLVSTLRNLCTIAAWHCKLLHALLCWCKLLHTVAHYRMLLQSSWCFCIAQSIEAIAVTLQNIQLTDGAAAKNVSLSAGWVIGHWSALHLTALHMKHVTACNALCWTVFSCRGMQCILPHSTAVKSSYHSACSTAVHITPALFLLCT